MLHLISRVIIGLLPVLILIIGVMILIGRSLPREIEIAFLTRPDAASMQLNFMGIDRQLAVSFRLPKIYSLLSPWSERYHFMLRADLGPDHYYIFTPRGMIPYRFLSSPRLYSLISLADGSTLQVAASSWGHNASSQGIYWVMPDGTRTFFFSIEGSIRDITPSPDSRWLLIETLHININEFETYLYDRATRRLTRFNPDSYTLLHLVTWSSDSRWIAAIATSDDRSPQLLHRHVLESRPSILISYTGTIQPSLSWSPDQERLAYILDSQLWVINRDSSQPQVLNLGSQAVNRPIWLADGRMLVIQYEINQQNLLLIDPDRPDLSPRRLWRGQGGVGSVLVMP